MQLANNRPGVVVSLAGLAAVWLAQPGRALGDENSLNLDMSAAYAQPESAASTGAAKPKDGFGTPGKWWLSLGGAYAYDFDSDSDIAATVGLSTFLANELEFIFEFGGWYFAQQGPNTGGASISMIGRWHFWHDEAFDWTVYGEAGIGVLGSGKDVPAGGTQFNFLPRLGAGFTKLLDDSGTRLQMGLAWHHISNARIDGDSNNPGRNSLMFVAAIVLPL